MTITKPFAGHYGYELSRQLKKTPTATRLQFATRVRPAERREEAMKNYMWDEHPKPEVKDPNINPHTGKTHLPSRNWNEITVEFLHLKYKDNRLRMLTENTASHDHQPNRRMRENDGVEGD
jgi:hypothetical protein